jgi:hypothetical protein
MDASNSDVKGASIGEPLPIRVGVTDEGLLAAARTDDKELKFDILNREEHVVLRAKTGESFFKHL